MSEAVGMIQILGFPGTLAAADAMLKAARIVLVEFDKGESGHFYIVIRGPNSEVQRSMPAGLKAVEETPGAELINYYIVPNPTDNTVDLLKLGFSEASLPFRS
ncbi:MAG: BMC domain-containing protein [Synechococcales cyanobacterium RM1_1_8]|nr:BMC domain-containing protein [Synechococcales cyanobacterium RM1_1_8]